MPNVAGVQFPYTPEGQQAAQQYQMSLSPAQGLGFRPLRMEQGGSPEAINIAKGLYALMSKGSTSEVEAYINKNLSDLEQIAQIDDPRFNMVRQVLSQLQMPQQMPQQMQVPLPTRPKPQEDFYPPLGEQNQGDSLSTFSGGALPYFNGEDPDGPPTHSSEVIPEGFNFVRKDPMADLQDPEQASVLLPDPPKPQTTPQNYMGGGTVHPENIPYGYKNAKQAGDTMRRILQSNANPGGIRSLLGVVR